MTIPFGRRRLVISLVTPRPAPPDIPAAFGATDQELVRLTRSADHVLALAQVELQAVLYGGGHR